MCPYLVLCNSLLLVSGHFLAVAGHSKLVLCPFVLGQGKVQPGGEKMCGLTQNMYFLKVFVCVSKVFMSQTYLENFLPQ